MVVIKFTPIPRAMVANTRIQGYNTYKDTTYKEYKDTTRTVPSAAHTLHNYFFVVFVVFISLLCSE